MNPGAGKAGTGGGAHAVRDLQTYLRTHRKPVAVAAVLGVGALAYLQRKKDTSTDASTAAADGTDAGGGQAALGGYTAPDSSGGTTADDVYNQLQGELDAQSADYADQLTGVQDTLGGQLDSLSQQVGQLGKPGGRKNPGPKHPGPKHPGRHPNKPSHPGKAHKPKPKPKHPPAAGTHPNAPKPKQPRRIPRPKPPKIPKRFTARGKR